MVHITGSLQGPQLFYNRTPVRGASGVRPQMRKRKYGHLNEQKCVEDTMVEDIDKSYAERAEASTSDACPEAQIHNLVGTAKIHSSAGVLDLFSISKILPNSVYDKQKFAAITIRIRAPACTVLLFTSGKMVLTGCRTFLECIAASHEVVQLLKFGVAGISFHLSECRIQNIVGNVDLKLLPGESMDLEQLHRSHSVFCTYQKNMFPGLIYRPNSSPVVLLIFVSGKVVITGGKSSNDVKAGWRHLWPFVRKFVKRDGAPAPGSA